MVKEKEKKEVRMEEDNTSDKKKIIIGITNLIGMILFVVIGLIIKHMWF